MAHKCYAKIVTFFLILATFSDFFSDFFNDFLCDFFSGFFSDFFSGFFSCNAGSTYVDRR